MLHARPRACQRPRQGSKAWWPGDGDPRLFQLPREPQPLDSVPAIRKVLELVTRETLAQKNSSQRSRAVGALLQIALKALEVGEIEERVEALEASLSSRRGPRAA